MSFRPIDLQINIGQLNHVARGQQQERLQPLQDQAVHAAHIVKEGDVKQHAVEAKSQPSNEESRVTWRKEKEAERRKRREARRQMEAKAAAAGGPGAGSDGDDFPEKGGYIDVLR